MTGSRIFIGVLGLFVFALIVNTTTLPEEVRGVPYLVGGVTFVLLIILMLSEFYPSIASWTDAGIENIWVRENGSGDTGAAPDAAAPLSTVLRMIAYIFGFWVMVFLLGFVIVPPVFITVFLTFEAEITFKKAAAAALVTTFILIAGMTLLRIDVWTGAVPEIIEGYVGGATIPPL